MDPFSDFESLRFSYESNLLHSIRNNLGPIPLLDQEQARHVLDARRRDLLGDAVRITAELLPDVHSVWRQCLDAVGGDLKGDLFVRQSETYNANVFAFDKRFDILVHSALLNDFTHEEMKFVFGHELGHVLFHHSLFPVQDLLGRMGDQYPSESRLLQRWARASEVSADRIGMLCCGRLGAAATALFRTASGLSGIGEDRALRSLRSQFEELQTHIRSVEKAPFWVRTHPMIPIRFKAIELGALDLIALNRNTGGFSAKGFRKIDQQIGFVMQALDID